MKKKILLIIRIIVFVLLTTVVFYEVYNVLKWKDTNGGYMSTVEQLYNSEKNSMDIVFMGSSHCYCGISPSYLWENYGMAAFNMSTSGQHKDSTVHMLKELLKTQRPQVVVIDLYALTYNNHAVLGNIYRNLLSLNTSVNSVELVKDYMKLPEEKRKNLPANTLEMIARWPIIHSRYKELTNNDFGEYEPNRYLRGEVYSWHTTSFYWGIDAASVTEATPVSEENKAWIDELSSLSDEYGFELAFMVLPYELGVEHQKIYNGAADYIRSKGHEYIDLNLLREDIEINTYTDMSDLTHLNTEGAHKVCEYLAENFLDKYNLEDHRGQAGYEVWERDLLFAKHEEINSMLAEDDVTGKEVVDCIKYIEGYTCILSLDGSLNEEICNSFSSIFATYGVGINDIAYGGKWVVRDGETRLINANNPLTPAFYLDLSKRDTLKIEFTESLAKTNIMIGVEELASPYYCMTIIVYDELLGETVFAKGY